MESQNWVFFCIWVRIFGSICDLCISHKNKGSFLKWCCNFGLSSSHLIYTAFLRHLIKAPNLRTFGKVNDCIHGCIGLQKRVALLLPPLCSRNFQNVKLWSIIQELICATQFCVKSNLAKLTFFAILETLNFEFW